MTKFTKFLVLLLAITLGISYSSTGQDSKSITVIAPNGGETYISKTDVEIQWSVENFDDDDKVKIEYLKGGAATPLADNINAADGTYSWFLAPYIFPKDNYTIKISLQSDETIFDVSDANFTVAKKAAEATPSFITSKEEAFINEEITLTNTSTGTTDEHLVTYSFFPDNKNNDEYETISGDSKTDLVIAWKKPGTKRVSMALQRGLWTSATVFKNIIIKEKVTLTAPNGSEVYNVCDDIKITWTAENFADDAKVKIEYIKGENDPFLISDIAEASAGTFTWRTSPMFPVGEDYKIKVSSMNDETVSDVSDAAFTINNPYASKAIPSFTVSKETANIDEEITLTNTSVVDGFEYEVNYLLDEEDCEVKSGDSKTTQNIAFKTAGSKTIAMTVKIGNWVSGPTFPKTITIVDPNATPKITVTAPNGGEAYDVVEDVDITWDVANFADGEKVQIQYIKGEEDPYTIATDIDASAGTYKWRILPMTDAGEDYKIKVSSMTDATVFDESDAVFTINDPYADVVADFIASKTEADIDEEITFINTSVVEGFEYEVIYAFGVDENDYEIKSGDKKASLNVAYKSAGPKFVMMTIKIGNWVSPPAPLAVINILNPDDPRIVVTAPNGGESIEKNKDYDITWTSRHLEGNTSIQLIKPASAPIVIAENVDVALGTYKWNVNADKGENYRIRITCGTNSDISDAVFSVVEQTPTVDLSLNKTKVVTDEEVVITATLANVPAETEVAYKWTVGEDGTISKDDKSKITVSFKNAGDKTVSVECTIGETVVTKEISFKVDTKDGIAELNSNSVGLYPQPAKAFINIELPAEGNFSATIYDLNGNAVKEINSTQINDKINVSDLNSGVYMINVMNAETSKSITQKLIIQ
ncbi:MAG: Ser-Thr-rich GPI-anchored membrane family protein [Hyphomicrobiales bacterium]